MASRTDYIIRESTEEDIAPVAENMRIMDVQEIWASHGHTPKQALTQGLYAEGECWTVLLDEEPIAMFGIQDTERPELGGVWFLGTDKVYEIKKAFYTEALEFLDRWNEQYPALFNIVDLRNDVSIKWMIDVGFILSETGFYATYEARPFALMMRYSNNV